MARIFAKKPFPTSPLESALLKPCCFAKPCFAGVRVARVPQGHSHSTYLSAVPPPARRECSVAGPFEEKSGK